MKSLTQLLCLGLATIALLASGCERKELDSSGEHVEFMKFFGMADEAVEMVEGDDGYTILANGADDRGFSYLELLHVNGLGDLVWNTQLKSEAESWKGHDLIHTLDGGYAVAGERYNAFGNGTAQLIRFDSRGDTLWTKENAIMDYNTGMFLTDTVTRKSIGHGVAELPDGKLALFSSEVSPDSGNVWLLQFYSSQDDTLTTGERWGGGYKMAAADIKVDNEDLVIFGEMGLFDPDFFSMKLLKSDDYQMASAIHNWSYWRESGEENFETPNGLDLSGQGTYLVGTTVSLLNAKPHLYAIRVGDFSEVNVWEYVQGDSTDDRSRGFGITALPNGGAVAVGEHYENGSWKLFAVEIGPDSVGFDTVNYANTGSLERSFIFGSQYEPESAQSILVTDDGSWLILGTSAYRGQSGVWLLKVNPAGLTK